MKTVFAIYLLTIILAAMILSGCSSVPKGLKELTLDDMYPILSYEQCQTLKSLNSDLEITTFIDEFWQSIDSTSGVRKNEVEDEYLQRLAYANEHFPDRRGWGRSDRKRIYLVYGPPLSIDRYEYTNLQTGQFSSIKSLEIWAYMTGGTNNALPSQGDDINKGEMKFIFGDVTGSGFYKILYSSEENSDIDLRMFNQN